MIKRSVSKLHFLFTFSLLFAIMMFLNKDIAYAANPISINTVDYENENIIVNNNANSKIYFATENDAARNSWETILADEGNTTSIDFSWVSPTTQQTIVIKGEDGVQRRVTLRERAKKLEVSISYDRMTTLKKTDTIALLLNIMSTAGTGVNPIDFDDLEWRKGENGSWQDTSSLTVAQLEKLQIKGADLYFRIKAINDIGYNADGTKGRRVSKEVRLKIAKKASPVVVGIDGEDFTADIRYGKEYRVTYYKGGNKITKDWVKVTDRSVRELPLEVILNDSYNGLTADKSFPAMLIEIRDYATARTAASKITEISLKEQRILPGYIVKGEAPENADASDANIYVSYNGSANISITIPSASTDNPYQYAIVKPGDIFDNERVSWATITRSSAVKVLASRAPEGSEIYIRQKEIKSRAATRTTSAVDYELASTYLKHKIEYPSTPVVEAHNFIFVKGISEDLTFNIKLNNIGKLPFETGIRTIKLGTRELKFTATPTPVIPNPPLSTVEYTIKVTLDKEFLNGLPNSYSRALYITFNNGTVDKNSIKLTIQNPGPAPTLSASPMKGSTAGTTKIRILSNVGSTNILVYEISDTRIEGIHTEYVVPASAPSYTSETDIPISSGKYVTVYEINSTTRKVVKYKSMQITSLYINP